MQRDVPEKTQVNNATPPRNYIYNGEFLTTETEFGWMCFPSDQLNHAISYSNPNFDIGMRRWIINNCRSDTTYIDIGLNAGTFCGIASRFIIEGQIISIEPIKNLERCIRMNVQLNNPLVKFKHFSCVLGEGMSDKTGTFEIFEFDNRVSTLFPLNRLESCDYIRSIDVEFKSLENLEIIPTKKVLIKIDAEGSEKFILEQIYKFSRKYKNTDFSICFEYALSHFERAGYGSSDIFEIINKKFGSCAYFIHPISSAEHPMLTDETKAMTGNVAFHFST